MAGCRFEGVLEPGPGGGAFLDLPADVLAALGGGVRFRVTGQLNGMQFASSTMAAGAGRVCLGVHKATRQAADVDFGDIVAVQIERDTSPREVTLPDELTAAFADDAAARSSFESLSFTRRREYVQWITSAKREATRARRVAQTVERLRA